MWYQLAARADTPDFYEGEMKLLSFVLWPRDDDYDCTFTLDGQEISRRYAKTWSEHSERPLGAVGRAAGPRHHVAF